MMNTHATYRRVGWQLCVTGSVFSTTTRQTISQPNNRQVVTKVYMEQFGGGMVDVGIARLYLRVKYVTEIKGPCAIYIITSQMCVVRCNDC